MSDYFEGMSLPGSDDMREMEAEMDQKVDFLIATTGIDDKYLIMSVLESKNFDVQECLGMLMEGKQAEQRIDLNVEVIFEDHVFKYTLRPYDTVATLHERIQQETNIVPADQMLVEVNSQEQLHADMILGNFALDMSLKLVLLTNNSAA
eukprot:m.47342 g.47342  ORF g.47342 m.47342 type:complete len:149 (+) comp7324_c0_seq2:47-493(+)